MSELIGIVTAASSERRNRPLDGFCQQASVAELLAEAAALDRFRRESDNLYERVRAQFFLYAIHRFHLPYQSGVPAGKPVPPEALAQILGRRFHEAIDALLELAGAGPTAALSSALAAAYRGLAFKRWPTRCAAACGRCAAINGCPAPGIRPITRCACAPNCCDRRRPRRISDPARIDAGPHGPEPQRLERHLLPGHGPARSWRGCSMSRSTWRARIRLARRSRPSKCFCASSTEPVLRLTSVDLNATADDHFDLAEVFDFGRDYLGLLKAAVIAAGHRAAGHGRSATSLLPMFWRAIDRNAGLRPGDRQPRERDIPKGSRLAVSTNLLASLISVLHARHRAGFFADGRLTENGAPPGGGARHSGRMAGRVRRGMAGFRRRVAGDQAD
jgi:hypothetical protein